MLSVDEARKRILSSLAPVPSETVALAEAWGRVCAEPLHARLRNPPADVSAMDGYAVRADDLSLGGTLRLIGEAAAGHPFPGRIGPGETVRIFTGSVIPEGADTVLIQENAGREGEAIVVGDLTARGRHIRPAGQDFQPGDVLIAAGRRMGARDIGVAAAGNIPWVTVRRRPRVALLATGDEIALPGDPIPPGGIVSSNSPMLAALVRAGGGAPVMLPVVPDDRDAIAEAGRRLSGIDLLVTIGGASVGDHDLVRSGLAAAGLTMDFWKIAMRPGKPLMHGRIGGVPMLGLPGNPVSALVCGLLFMLPALARLGGEPESALPPALQPQPARLGAALPANDERADHLRASLTTGANGQAVVTPFPRQDSGMLRRLAASEALILRAPLAPAVPAGEMVPILRLDQLGI